MNQSKDYYDVYYSTSNSRMFCVILYSITGGNAVNINLPVLMEDELLFSFVTRMTEAIFFPVKVFVDNVLANPKVQPVRAFNVSSVENKIFIPKLSKLLDVDPLEFYLKTTIYPGTAPLQTHGKQSRIINLAFRETIYKYPLLSGRPKSDISQLKFCPVCYADDMNTHGYSWLRRIHHMPFVSV